MLGPINAYQVQQQNVQNSQKNPNSQPFLAQEKNNQRTERLNETKPFGEALSDANRSNNTQDDIEQRAQGLIAQGKTERGAMLDIVA